MTTTTMAAAARLLDAQDLAALDAAFDDAERDMRKLEIGRAHV